MGDNHSETCANVNPECLCLKCVNDNAAMLTDDPCCFVVFQTVKRHCPVTKCRKYQEEVKNS